MGSRSLWFALAVTIFCCFALAGVSAPEFVSSPNLSDVLALPWEHPPFGTDDRGIALTEYASQGAQIVTVPALMSGLLVAAMATMAGLVRCSGSRLDGAIQALGELIGSLPRMVVILVIALVLPRDWRGLAPIGMAWAVLSSPGAMDEAAATAGRLGGARFVEALRAHGFSAGRIYLYHVVWLNLRSVIARQASEVAMQVVFLEIALSYLAVSGQQPAFTHSDSSNSWAILLYQGYASFLGVDSQHSLWLAVFLLAAVAGMAQSLRLSARAR